jgi:hypothetical protein
MQCQVLWVDIFLHTHPRSHKHTHTQVRTQIHKQAHIHADTYTGAEMLHKLPTINEVAYFKMNVIAQQVQIKFHAKM